MFSRLLLLLPLVSLLGAQQPEPSQQPAPAGSTESGQPAKPANSRDDQARPGQTQSAQSETDQTSPNQNQPAQSDPNPPPPQNTVVAPPEVISSTLPEAPGSSGPGVLTRGYSVTPLEGQEIRFRPYIDISGIVDSGFTGVSTQNGQFVSQTDEGVDLGFGIDGRRLFRKDTIELEFRGDLYHYTPNSFYDGGNYVLDLTYTHQFNRHVTLALEENAGLYSNNYALLNNTTDLSLANTSILVTPNTQLFDNSTIYLSTGADLLYELTPRLSVDIGGSGFIVRRQDSSLYGTVGAQARVDLTYRSSRRATWGPYYGYTRYDFNKAFGGSNIETVGLLYSYAFTRSLQFRVRGGGSQVVTDGLETVVIDPTIAALLGYSQGQIAIHRTNYVPDISAQIFKTFRVGTASVELTDGVSPGNGLFLTSRHVAVSGHYDYVGLRRWTFQIGGSRDTLTTLGVLVGQYTSYIGDAGVVRVLSKGFQANFRAEYRHYDIAGAPFLRNSYRLSLGVAWTPSERPLKLF